MTAHTSQTDTPPPETHARRRHAVYWLLLAGLVLAHVVVNAVWIHRDLSIRSYDGGPHLEAHVQAARILGQQGLAGLVGLVRPEEPGWWPSAGYVPAAALALVFGAGFDQARLYNLLYLALLLVSVAQIGRRLHTREAGLLAAAMVGLLPVVYGEGRNLGVDMPGTAVLCACVWLLLTTRGFARLGRCAWLGVALGCGMLIRPQVALFFAPVALASLLLDGRGPGARRSRKARLTGAALALAAAVVTTSPWWLGHVEEILRTAARHQLDAAMLSENRDSSPLFYLEALPWGLPLWLIPGALLALWGWLGKGSPARARASAAPFCSHDT